MKEIYSIIPEIIEKHTARIKLFIKGFKNKKAIKAPIGSAIPDKNVYLKALALLLVEKYIGTAIEIPSGIL